MPPTHAHFNGSVNLADAESVMREIASRVPAGLRRIPDGETGDRGNWIFFQMQRFMQMPTLVPARPIGAEDGDYEALPQLRLADGVEPDQVEWPNIGYADAYLASYRTFSALREEGVIPAGVRFQAEYPTPLASIGGYIVPEQQMALIGSYEQAMFADLDRLLAAIPHDEVAVQWDVAVEFGVLEDAFGPGGAQAFDMIIAALARCVDQVPADVPAGLHLCYGDYGHQHFKQPESLALQVRLLNAVAAAASRAGELRLVHRAAVPAGGKLLRATGRADHRPGHRAELRPGAVPSGRAGPGDYRGAGAAHRRGADRQHRRAAGVGHLHRMRHGPRGPGRDPGPARRVPPDPHRLTSPATRLSQLLARKLSQPANFLEPRRWLRHTPGSGPSWLQT